MFFLHTKATLHVRLNQFGFLISIFNSQQKSVFEHGFSYIVCLQATGDAHYLEVGRSVLESLNQYARVPCGFAAVMDVRTGSHEDR